MEDCAKIAKKFNKILIALQVSSWVLFCLTVLLTIGKFDRYIESNFTIGLSGFCLFLVIAQIFFIIYMCCEKKIYSLTWSQVEDLTFNRDIAIGIPIREKYLLFMILLTKIVKIVTLSLSLSYFITTQELLNAILIWPLISAIFAFLGCINSFLLRKFNKCIFQYKSNQ